MPGPVYKDSFSRCEAPSMLYDMVRDPQGLRKPIKTAPVSSVDTLESTQRRLNREIFERFKTHGLSLPHESFVAVVQVGKYVFLAIMLPPYLCFYGLPRWFFLNVLPPCGIFIKQQFFRVGRMMQKLKKTVPDLMKGVIDQLIGDSLRTLNQRAKNFLKVTANALIATQKGVVFLWNKGVTYAKAVETAIDTVRNAYRKMRDFPSKVQRAIKRKVAELARKAVIKVGQTLHKIVVVPFIEALQIPLLAMKRTYEKATRNIQTIIRKTREKAKQASEVVAKAMQLVTQKVVEGYHLLVNPLANILSKQFARGRSWLDRTKQVAEKMVGKIIEAATSATQTVVAKMQQAGMQFLHFIQTSAQNVFSFGWQATAKQRGKIKQIGEMLKERGKRFGRILQKGVNKVISLLEWCGSQTQQGLKWMAAQLKAAMQWLRRELIAFPSRVLRFLGKLWRLFIKFFRNLVWGVRIAIAWTWAISCYGAALVRELADEMAGWFKAES